MMSIQPVFDDQFLAENGGAIESSGCTKLAVPLTGWDGGLVRITVDLRNGGAKFRVDLVKTIDCDNPVVALIAGSTDRLSEVPKKLDEHVRRLCELEYKPNVSVLDYFCRNLDQQSRAALKSLLQDTSGLLANGGTKVACH